MFDDADEPSAAPLWTPPNLAEYRIELPPEYRMRLSVLAWARGITVPRLLQEWIIERFESTMTAMAAETTGRSEDLPDD